MKIELFYNNTYLFSTISSITSISQITSTYTNLLAYLNDIINIPFTISDTSGIIIDNNEIYNDIIAMNKQLNKEMVLLFILPINNEDWEFIENENENGKEVDEKKELNEKKENEKKEIEKVSSNKSLESTKESSVKLEEYKQNYDIIASPIINNGKNYFTVEEPSENLVDWTSKITELSNTIDLQSSEISSLYHTKSENTNKITELLNENDKLKNMIINLNADKQVLKWNNDKCTNEIIDVSDKLSQNTLRISSLTTHIETLKKEIEFLNTKNAGLESEKNRYLTENDIILKEIMFNIKSDETLPKSLDDILGSHRIAISSLESEVAIYQHQVSEVQTRFLKTQVTVEALQKQLCDTESTYLKKDFETSQEISQLNAKLRDAENEYNSAIKLTQSQYENVRKQLDDFKIAECDMVKQHRAQIQVHENKEKEYKKQSESLRTNFQNALLSIESLKSSHLLAIESLKSSHSLDLKKKDDYAQIIDHSLNGEIAKLKAKLEKKVKNSKEFESLVNSRIAFDNLNTKDVVLLVQKQLDSKSYHPLTTDKTTYRVSADSMQAINQSGDPSFSSLWVKKAAIASLPRFVLATIIHTDVNDDASKVLTCEINKFFP